MAQCDLSSMARMKIQPPGTLHLYRSVLLKVFCNESLRLSFCGIEIFKVGSSKAKVCQPNKGTRRHDYEHSEQKLLTMSIVGYALREKSI